ncbi:hypothetical protein OEA41_005562 [Lepraria neglecta]|uniref:Uncharacterized protein n=1 Tax=Lepraria neglecta TaxID=209136 RepID=A0AAE0DJD2_9LECA|nr:hypothetical protein OEA41_005562 [Lepraria neglecta]
MRLDEVEGLRVASAEASAAEEESDEEEEEEGEEEEEEGFKESGEDDEEEVEEEEEVAPAHRILPLYAKLCSCLQANLGARSFGVPRWRSGGRGG